MDKFGERISFIYLFTLCCTAFSSFQHHFTFVAFHSTFAFLIIRAVLCIFWTILDQAFDCGHDWFQKNNPLHISLSAFRAAGDGCISLHRQMCIRQTCSEINARMGLMMHGLKCFFNLLYLSLYLRLHVELYKELDSSIFFSSLSPAGENKKVATYEYIRWSSLSFGWVDGQTSFYSLYLRGLLGCGF